MVDVVHQEALAFRYFKGAARINDAALPNGLERMARVNRDTDEVILVTLRDTLRRLLQMDERKSIRDNISMVSGNLEVPPATGLKNKLCPHGNGISALGG